jgi:cytochrome P450
MDTAAWSSSLPQPLADVGASWHFPSGLDAYQTWGILFFTMAAIAYLTSTKPKDSKNFPMVNPSSDFEIVGKTRRKDFALNGTSYFNQGVESYPGKPFKVMADYGELHVLPAKWAHDIRNEPNLHFMKTVHEDFHADYAPFKPFAAGTADDALLQSVARGQLTRYLNKVTEPLSAETKFALDLTYGAPTDWQEFPLKENLLDIVSRISSCVFLGDKLCRNEEWLEITKSYTVLAFLAAAELRLYPKWLRGIAQLYLPKCRELVNAIDRARTLISAIVQERRMLASQGKYQPTHTDAIDWFEEEAAGRPYDPVLCQMILSTAAIHTTSNLANVTMLNLAQHPGLVQEVRQEIIEVLSVDGWKKSSLYNLKLLDSVLKESQRLCRNSIIMNRVATADVSLPDGSILRKGERAVVSTSGMIDPEIYDDPLKFDPYRFVRLREQEGKQNQAHLVSTGPGHLGFGHGKHACPGRFFASNELKVLFCHIVMKYDFRLPKDYTPRTRDVAGVKTSDPASRVLLKARKPEIDIDALDG